MDIIPHLFKTEHSKIVAVLTGYIGLEHLEIAEDVAGETFLLALDTWPYKGIPPNPTAWLYTVAKNKIKNHLVRNSIFKEKILRQVNGGFSSDEMNIDFTDQNIEDSQLQMLFAVCHPAISVESQICLALRLLCGLGLDEIADAFLSNKETIHKRLLRAKKKLQKERIKLEMPDNKEMQKRVETVLQTIYLLFSEGYYSENGRSIVRYELCTEAINLTYLLLENPLTNNHHTNALMSIMCFHSSRFEARTSGYGETILYDDQDRKLWDTEFIEKGFYYLQQASAWQQPSKYYLEASIAYWHTVDNPNSDKWVSILKLYDALIAMNQVPMAEMNRIWAFSKVHGTMEAIREAEKLEIHANHFYFILLAELYKSVDSNRSIQYLSEAKSLCKGETQKNMIQKRIEDITLNQEDFKM